MVTPFSHADPYGAVGSADKSCQSRSAKLNSRRGVNRSQAVDQSRLAPLLRRRVIVHPSVSIAAWVSCSPSMIDSASNGESPRSGPLASRGGLVLVVEFLA